MNKNKSKKFVIISLLVATTTSLVVAFIMSKYLATDVSKTRFKLTKNYKAAKDIDFVYDQAKGQKVYTQLCAKCHKADGSGSKRYPSLKLAESVSGDAIKLIKITIYGVRGEIIQGENTYNGVMPGFKNIPHEDLAQALSYVREEFGNTPEIPTIEIIKGKIDFIEQKGPMSYQAL